MRKVLFPFIAMAALAAAENASYAADVSVITDDTWKTTSPAPPTGWNTDVGFDDSSWVNAVKATTTNNRIWMTSNMSGVGPSQAWFRHIFTLSSPVASAVGDFHFDDNGENYLNGHLIINDPGGGATDFAGVTIDPSFFVVGQNLFAIHGIDTIAPFHTVSADIEITLSTGAVPEPASLAIFGVGACALMRRRRRV